MNRNIIRLLVSLIVTASLLLAACSTAAPEEPSEAPTFAPPTLPPPETKPTDVPTQPSETVGGKAKVVIFIGMGTGTDPDQIAAQEALQEKFNSTHDTIEVEFLIVPHDEAGERFLAMVSGGNAPQLVGPNGISTVAQFYDVWEDVKPFIEKDKLDLSDFYGPAVTLNQYPDKTVGLPLGLFPSFIFYNKDLFDAAGVEYPPADFGDTAWNIETLRDKALELTLDTNGNNAKSPDFDPENIAQWGYDDSWADARGMLTFFGAENVGRPTTVDYKTAVVNSEEWVFGLNWFNDAIWKEHFVPDSAGQEAYYAVGGDPFGGGLVAMFHSHTWFMAEGLIDLPFEYDIAPMPFNQKDVRISRLHADTFTIPKGATNKEAAWEVLKWLTSAENIGDVCLIYGCIPARQSVQDQFLAALQERYPGLDYNVIFESIDSLDIPNHESYVPEWGRVAELLDSRLGAVYTQPVDDVEALMNEVNSELQAILDEYWANK
jgi:multiple sugar transport system substrate-binding protein